MMTDHVPSYHSILLSSILNHAYWYWALVLAMCCFMMTDHVPSFHIILNRPFSIIYIPSTKCICIYVYIFMYIWKNPIPNTQYTKRISKDPVSANILPQYWPIMHHHHNFVSAMLYDVVLFLTYRRFIDIITAFVILSSLSGKYWF